MAVTIADAMQHSGLSSVLIEATAIKVVAVMNITKIQIRPRLARGKERKRKKLSRVSANDHDDDNACDYPPIDCRGVGNLPFLKKRRKKIRKR